MYINKIDELIDELINDFYLSEILNNKVFYKIIQDNDFVKYQKEINDIMIKYTSERINMEKIRQNIKNNMGVYQLIESIKRYIAFYLFMTIGFFFTGKSDAFINNIIEFTKNQVNYNYKIYDFFNSNSNSLLIQFYNLIVNILTILNADQAKIDKIKLKSEFTETIVFLNKLGGEYINSFFKLKNNQVGFQCHNIVKTIILKYLYNEDKKDFFKILEQTEINEGEYMFIDVVVSTKKIVDYSLIEKILESSIINKSRRYLPYYLWNFLVEYEEKKIKPPMSTDEKILKLINNGLIVPIVDDFLLFHKDTEKYDKNIDETKIKKKEDTKIKYIINKLDRVKLFYSEQIKNDKVQRSEIKKFFYGNLLNRKAVLINIRENINIINKHIELKKYTTDTTDFFKDLEQYTLYPYINFSDFENSGFSITLTENKVINVVRYVSLMKDGEFKQHSLNNILQTRVGVKDMVLNIVGFLIPSTKTSLQCIKLKNAINVRSIDKKIQNGVELILKYLKETNLNMSEHFSSVYWIFDENKDKIINKSYEQTNSFTIHERINNLVAGIYDELIYTMYELIIKIMEEKKIGIQKGYEIIDYFSKNILYISEENDIYIELEKKIFELVKIEEIKYNSNEDEMYELNETKENEINNKNKNKNIPSIKINLSSIDEYGKIKNKESIIGICQHNITMEQIAEINKKEYTKFYEEMYNFVQKYVIMDVNDEPICKSCGFSLDIKKYIEDGEYNNETRTFESFATPIEINLEEIIGYEKYKITIRQMDKIIEKIASISNILHLTKGTVNVKSKRKMIIKNAIDIINIHNKKIKEKKEIKSEKKYGTNKNYSNFWNFELDNNIFIFSSKDIDKMKPIKTNNVITYIMFLILLEINHSHILFMNDKKKCPFNYFQDMKDKIFNDLKIIVNNKGETDDISKYNILCYMIFIMSCTISSTGSMWYYNPTEGTKKNVIQFMIQKSIIHTLIDIINSVLEMSITENDIIYKNISSHFFKKIQSFFKDEELFNRIKKESSIKIFENKTSYIQEIKNLIPLTGKYEPISFLIPERRSCKCSTVYMNKKEIKQIKYNGISNITNCNDGKYHTWKFNEKKDKLMCILCNEYAENISFDEKNSKEVKKKYINVKNEEIAKKICVVDGLPHIFDINENGENVCRKCKNFEYHNYSEKEVEDLFVVINKNNKIKENELFELSKETKNFSEKKVDYINTVVGKLYDEFSKYNKYEMDFLNNLIEEIQKTIGSEIQNLNLINNIYIIDHDHIGNSLEKNIIIDETTNKMFKKNHPFFKSEVLYYVNYKFGKIEVYYDYATKMLLGYKEENKNIILNRKFDKKIKLNYSILNKIKLFGYKSAFIKIDLPHKNDAKINEKNENIKNSIIEKILFDRILNLKKIITNIKLIISRIINNHNEEYTENDYNKSKIFSLIEKYKKKMSEVKLQDAQGNIIFKHWKAVINGVNFKIDKNQKLNFEDKNIGFEEINKIDKMGNLLVFYIFKEFMKLYEFNNDKISKITISNFIVDFINVIYDLFNEDKNLSNIDVKRFIYILNSNTNIEEIQEKSNIVNFEGIYTEYQDLSEEKKSIEQEVMEKEEKYDFEQEQEAYDIDIEQEDVIEQGDMDLDPQDN